MSKDKPAEEFNAQAISEKIERCMARGDGDGAIQEISRPWPGMDDDIRIAVRELILELEQNGTAPLFMKDMAFDDDTETVGIQFPDWFEAANRVFQQRYPNSIEAGLRFQKTIATLHHRLLIAREQPQLGLEELIETLQEWLPPGWPSYHSTRLH